MKAMFQIRMNILLLIKINKNNLTALDKVKKCRNKSVVILKIILKMIDLNHNLKIETPSLI